MSRFNITEKRTVPSSRSESKAKPVVHEGFKAVQKKIAKKYGKEEAGAILGDRTRRASKAAKKRNPRLKRVLGTPKRTKI